MEGLDYLGTGCCCWMNESCCTESQPGPDTIQVHAGNLGPIVTTTLVPSTPEYLQVVVMTMMMALGFQSRQVR